MDAEFTRHRLAIAAQCRLSGPCPPQQTSVVHCAPESFRLVTSSECIHGNTRHRLYPAIRGKAKLQIPPLPLSGFAAEFPNRELLRTCALTQCAPIHETWF